MTSTPTTEANQPTLAIDSLTKTFRGVRANDNISVRLHSGEVTAIIGHNGAGKTTFLNQLVGLTRPDAGTITYNGHNLVQHPSIARQLSVIMPQANAALEGTTPRAAITMVLRVRGISGHRAQQAAEHTITTLDISDWADRPGAKLSGGLKRLTSFAMAVAAPAPIYLFDEPTNDVDPVRRELLWRATRARAKQGAVVLVVTHNLLEVERHADRYLLFDKGKLIHDAPTSALREAEAKSTLTLAASADFFASLDEYLPKDTELKRSQTQEQTFTLSADKLESIMPTLLAGIRSGEVLSYRLGSASLADSYEEMTNND